MAYSDIELVVRESKKLEHRLVTELGAPEAGGLHEKITAVEHLFHPDVIKVLRRLATIRNAIIHKMGEDSIRNRPQYEVDIPWCHQAIDLAKPALAAHQAAARRVVSQPVVQPVVAATQPAQAAGKGCAVFLAVVGSMLAASAAIFSIVY